jgi:hypothetical protein
MPQMHGEGNFVRYTETSMTDGGKERFGVGWAWPENSRKAHYFEAGSITSLCHRWIFGGDRENDRHDSQDNCAECKRLYKRKIAKPQRER